MEATHVLWVSTLSALSSSNQCVGVQLTKDGRLSFSRLARLLGISISDPDCLDTWTLGDVNLIIDKESKELLTEGPVWGLYDLPLGTKAQPVQLCTGQTVGTCSHGTTPVTKTAAAASSRGTRTRTPSSATRRAAAAADISTNTSAGLGIGAAPSPLPSPLPSAHASPHCRRKTPNATGGPAAAAKPAQPSTQADSCLEALPRGPIPPPAALVAAAGQKDVCSLSACGLFAAASMPGAHFFLLAEAHLPLLMAAHLPTAQQAALRRFSPQAQALLVARAMARYRAAHMHNYFESRTMATAITKALKEGAATNRSTSAPPINTLPACPRLSGIKRRLPDAPTPAKAAWADAGEDAPTPMVIDFDASSTGGGGAVAVAGTSHAGSAAEWRFVGGGRVACPGAVCAKTQRTESLHANFLYVDACGAWCTYLPVLHEAGAGMVVLLPLDDAPCMEKQQQAPSQQPRGQQAQQGQHGSHTLQVHGQARCRGGAALPPSSPLPSQQQQQLSSQPTWQWPPTPSALPYPLPTAQPSPRPLIAASAHHYGTQGGTGKLAAGPAYAGLQQGQLQGQQPPMGAGVTWFRYYVPGTSSSSTSEASGTADRPAGAAATPGQHGRSRAYDAAAPGAAGAQPEAQAVAGAVQARRGFWGDGLSAELWGAVHDLYGPSMLQALKAAVKG